MLRKETFGMTLVLQHQLLFSSRTSARHNDNGCQVCYHLIILVVDRTICNVC